MAKSTAQKLAKPFFTLFALSAWVVGAASETTIRVENCESSHHGVRIYSQENNNLFDSDSADFYYIHSNSTQFIKCDGKKCHLKFESGGQHVDKNSGNNSWYVHVKKNHTFTVSSDRDVC